MAESLRPFNVVEDSGFRDLAAFFCRVNGKFSVPTRNTLRARIEKMAILVENKMRSLMGGEMKYFAATTDMWSGRTREAFIAVTVHYLTSNFTQRNFTIEVSPVRGRHTAVNIKHVLTESFRHWGISDEKLSIMARDNGSNIVAACNSWGIKHIGCIGHGLHLVVNPFLQKSNNKNVDESDGNDEVATVEDDGNDEVHANEDEDIANFEDYDEPEDTLISIDFVSEIRKTVSDIRKIATFIKNSTAAKEKLQYFEGASNETGGIVDIDAPLLTLVLDVSTRWNSAYDMLTKILKHKDSIISFLHYLKTSAGRREFSNKKLPTISSMQWACIEGLCILLKPFYELTKVLSGEKNSTLVVAIPLLRMVKSILSNRNMFIAQMKNQIQIFRDKYEEEDFYKETLRNLDACREELLQLFSNRFTGHSFDILWIGYLDPRQTDMLHLKDDEK